MPTLGIIDGLGHQSLSTSGGGIWNTTGATGAFSFDTTIKHDGLCSVKMVQTGASEPILAKNVTPNQNVFVASLRFRVATAPSVKSAFCRCFAGSTASRTVYFYVNTDGTISAQLGGGTERVGPNVADGNWHLLQYRYTSAATPNTCDWRVDEVDQTQTSDGSGGQVATFRLIGGNGTAGTLTIWVDSFIASYTSGDYPIASHEVLDIVATGDGTHVGGTNVIEDDAGTDIVTPGYTTAWQKIDEWPAVDTNDHIRQFATGASNYAECTLTDTTASAVWDAHGYLAYMSAGASPANAGVARVVLSDGTTVDDILSGDMSETSIFFASKLLTRPAGGWTPSNFNASLLRVGFSSDAAPVPHWDAILLAVAVPVSAGGRTTKNTRAFPLGMDTGSGMWVHG